MDKIEFHCPQCDKLIKAPPGSGGKRGKCPACGRSVYVPTPSEDLEPYDLAPVDEAEERRQAKLQAEALAQEQAILHDQTGLDESEAGPPKTTEDLRQLIISYLLAMTESRLDDADRVVAQLRGQKKAARAIIDELSVDSIPPEQLADIPDPVLKGFLKSLSSAL